MQEVFYLRAIRSVYEHGRIGVNRNPDETVLSKPHPKLQRYAHLVIHPRCVAPITPGALDALRRAAAWRFIFARPNAAINLAIMTRSAPADQPFAFSDLDAERMRIDALHLRAMGGAA